MAHSRVWDASYEALPADLDDANTLGLRQRNTRTDVRERMEVDHDWDDVTHAGKHNQVTLQEQGAKPTASAAEGYVYTKDVSALTELFYEDDAGTEVQITNSGAVAGIGSGLTLTAGVIASRPAAATAGLLYLATDIGELYRDSGSDWISCAAWPRGYIDGLIMSNGTDADHDIDFAAGVCRDKLSTRNMRPSAMTKQLDVTWAAGTAAGGLNDADIVGGIVADTTYHCFALGNIDDATFDFGFDTNVAGTQLLADTAVVAAGLTTCRRIGSVITDGTTPGNILAFMQTGDNIHWRPRLHFDYQDTSPGTTQNTITLGQTPLGIATIAKLIVQAKDNSPAGITNTLIGDGGVILTSGGSVKNLATHANSESEMVYMEIKTNTSREIEQISDVDGGDHTINVYVLGYIDLRGKDA